MRIVLLIGIGLAVAILLLGLALAWIAGGGSMLGRLFGKEVAAVGDLPWAGPGLRARQFSVSRWDWNTGTTRERHWGSGRFSKQNPVETVYEAFAYLEKHRAMNGWPPALPGDAGTFQTYSVYDELLPGDRHERNGYGETVVTYTKRIAPYRFFLVSIEPTVVLMRPAPELIDWWQDYVRREYASDSRWVEWIKSQPEQQSLWVIWLENLVQFGTRLPPGEGWMWFSPELGRQPAALPLSADSPLSVPLAQGRLLFAPEAAGWRVLRE